MSRWYQHNISPIDKYSILHLLAGMFFALLYFPFWLVLLMCMGFEIIEHPLKHRVQKWFKKTPDESLENAVFDVVFVMLGWLIGWFILGYIFG